MYFYDVSQNTAPTYIKTSQLYYFYEKNDSKVFSSDRKDIIEEQYYGEGFERDEDPEIACLQEALGSKGNPLT